MANEEWSAPQWRHVNPVVDPPPWDWRYFQRITFPPFPPGPGPGDPPGFLMRGIDQLVQQGIEKEDIVALQQAAVDAARTQLKANLNAFRAQGNAQLALMEKQAEILSKYARQG